MPFFKENCLSGSGKSAPFREKSALTFWFGKTSEMCPNMPHRKVPFKIEKCLFLIGNCLSGFEKNAPFREKCALICHNEKCLYRRISALFSIGNCLSGLKKKCPF